VKATDIRMGWVRELKRRDPIRSGEPQLGLRDFHTRGVGNHMLVPDGQGSIDLLVPEGLEPAKKELSEVERSRRAIDLAPGHNKTKNTEELMPDQDLVEVPGLGWFSRYPLGNPARFLSFGERGERPEIALKGGPFSGDRWQKLDVKLLIHRSQNEGVDVGPPPVLDKDHPDWVELLPQVREASERKLNRPLPKIVHLPSLREELALVPGFESILADGLAGLDRRKDQGPAISTVREPETAAPARPILMRVLGKELFEQGQASKTLLNLAEDVLRESGNTAEAATVVARRRGESVTSEDLSRAVDLAFGYGFNNTRSITLKLLDAVIDGFSSGAAKDDKQTKLSIDDLLTLHRLREDLVNQKRAKLSRGSVATPIRDGDADESLLKLHRALIKGTGLDENTVFTAARALQTAINAHLDGTPIIILSGKRGTGADRLYRNMLGACPSERVVQLQGPTELLDDPLGTMIGSPSQLRGTARALLLPEPGTDEHKGRKTVFGIDHAERMGDGDRDQQRRVYGFLRQIMEAGWCRAYDPNDADKRAGFELDLKDNVIILRTEQSFTELRAAMGDDAFAMLSPYIVELESSDHQQVLDELEARLAAFVEKTYRIEGARVSLSGPAKTFALRLLREGMPPQVLQRRVLDQFVGLTLRVSDDDPELARHLEVDVLGGYTGKMLSIVVADWLAGKQSSIPPFGGKVFEVFDAEKVAAEPELRVDARFKVRSTVEKRLEDAELLIIDMRLGQAELNEALKNAAAENALLRSVLKGAEKRIGELRTRNQRQQWVIQKLEDLKAEAERTIVKLHGQLDEANQEINQLNAKIKQVQARANQIIEAQNRDIGDLKSNVQDLIGKVQHRENDIQRYEQALHNVQVEYRRGMQQLMGGIAGRDARSQLDFIRNAASQGGGQFSTPALLEAFTNAGRVALAEARQLRDRFNKFDEIADIANRYRATSQALERLGLAPSPGVERALEECAYISGGEQGDASAAWRRQTGAQPQLQTQDTWYDILRPVAELARVQLPRLIRRRRYMGGT
jgi:hypothetical protein